MWSNTKKLDAAFAPLCARKFGASAINVLCGQEIYIVHGKYYGLRNIKTASKLNKFSGNQELRYVYRASRDSWYDVEGRYGGKCEHPGKGIGAEAGRRCAGA
jgi:hypothetical protein